MPPFFFVGGYAKIDGVKHGDFTGAFTAVVPTVLNLPLRDLTSGELHTASEESVWTLES